MQAIVPQTGYSARLLLSLLHGGYSLSEAQETIASGDADSPRLPSAETRELFRRHLDRIEEAIGEGDQLDDSVWTYSVERGLEQLGVVPAALAA